MVVYEGRSEENNGEKLSVEPRAQLEALRIAFCTHTPDH